MGYDEYEKLSKYMVKRMGDTLLKAEWIHAELSMRNGEYDDFTVMDIFCGACESELIDRGIMTQGEILDIDEDTDFDFNTL